MYGRTCNSNARAASLQSMFMHARVFRISSFVILFFHRLLFLRIIIYPLVNDIIYT